MHKSISIVGDRCRELRFDIVYLDETCVKRKATLSNTHLWIPKPQGDSRLTPIYLSGKWQRFIDIIIMHV